jgi:hypothetical protein
MRIADELFAELKSWSGRLKDPALLLARGNDMEILRLEPPEGGDSFARLKVLMADGWQAFGLFGWVEMFGNGYIYLSGLLGSGDEKRMRAGLEAVADMVIRAAAKRGGWAWRIEPQNN